MGREREGAGRESGSVVEQESEFGEKLGFVSKGGSGQQG